MERKAKRSRRTHWNKDDEELFLSCWEKYQQQIRKCHRNTHVYESISADMSNKFTAEEIRIKIKNFSQKYRQEKKDMHSFGENQSEWRHFAYVNRIIGSNAANNHSYEGSFKQENSLDISDTSDAVYSDLKSVLPFVVPTRLSSVSPTTNSELSNSDPVYVPERPFYQRLEFKDHHHDDSLPGATKPVSESFARYRSATFQSVKKDDLKSPDRKRKRNENTFLDILAEQGEEHLDLLRKAVEDNKAVSKEIVELLKKQSETDKQIIDLLTRLVDKN